MTNDYTTKITVIGHLLFKLLQKI